MRLYYLGSLEATRLSTRPCSGHGAAGVLRLASDQRTVLRSSVAPAAGPRTGLWPGRRLSKADEAAAGGMPPLFPLSRCDSRLTGVPATVTVTVAWPPLTVPVTRPGSLTATQRGDCCDSTRNSAGLCHVWILSNIINTSQASQSHFPDSTESLYASYGNRDEKPRHRSVT
jgi:hypothetical protein